MHTPRVPFLLRWMWLPCLAWPVIEVIRGMNDHFGITDGQMASAIGWGFFGVLVDVVLVVVFLARVRPADYQAVKAVVGTASALYLAYEVYEHEHDRHLQHAVDQAMKDHDARY